MPYKIIATGEDEKREAGMLSLLVNILARTKVHTDGTCHNKAAYRMIQRILSQIKSSDQIEMAGLLLGRGDIKKASRQQQRRFSRLSKRLQ